MSRTAARRPEGAFTGAWAHTALRGTEHAQ
jgi:hypothetical protein